MKFQDEDIKALAQFIYQKIFQNYTRKQWGLKPEELDSKVIERVPIYIGEDDGYFREDKYQGIPEKGYASMFKEMLNHPNIKVLLKTDYRKVINRYQFKRIVVTSRIDEFYAFRFGQIAYRKIFLKFETHNCSSYQKYSVINYPNNYKYTRTTEYNKFLQLNRHKTIISKEFPSWTKGFIAYPVLKPDNQNLIRKYLKLAGQEKNIYFIGRLAECRYYNMDQACRRGLDLIRKEMLVGVN
jgi:UDP-galactopyranose mutase